MGREACEEASPCAGGLPQDVQCAYVRHEAGSRAENHVACTSASSIARSVEGGQPRPRAPTLDEEAFAQAPNH